MFILKLKHFRSSIHVFVIIHKVTPIITRIKYIPLKLVRIISERGLPAENCGRKDKARV